MNAIDYLGIIESVLFLVYICPLQFSMIMFILTNDLLISFINRDLLGITSYLLIILPFFIKIPTFPFLV